MHADIVHFHDFQTMWSHGLFGYLLLKMLRKKIYITFHGWEGVFPPHRKIIRRRRICEKRADGNICIGHFICKWYGTRASIVSYGGVNRYTGTTRNDRYIVYVGRLAKDTGIIAYLRAWEIVSKSMPGMNFVICGDGLLRGELEEYVRSKSIRNVQFKGFVTNADEYVRDAAAVLTSGYLGMLEAFSLQKPVIATYDNELKRDYLEMMPGSSELIWIARESDDIAKGIMEALTGNDRVRKAYEYSLHNSWLKVKEDYYSLWEYHDNRL
jgi:glycosyltransferase involved in cell wall biosynthesis